MKFFLAIAVLAAVCVGIAMSAPLSSARGWGDDIEWYSYEEALKVSEDTGKPVMIVLHKTWCGACKRLKPQFAVSEEIAELSINFVMVNAEDDEAPHTDARYQLDGGYIPRIYFTRSDGTVIDQLNDSRAASGQYLYFYSSAPEVVDSMKKVDAME